MQRIIRSLVLLIVVLGLSFWAVYPPDQKLRLGKDLAGGVSLVYTVDVSQEENSMQVLSKVMEAVKDRVDPQGIFEISITSQGSDRIEIQMPLPRQEVKDLRAAYEDKLTKMGKYRVNQAQLELVFKKPADQRGAELGQLSVGNPVLLAKLNEAAADFDALARTRAEKEAAGLDDAKRRALIDRERAERRTYDAAVEELIENVVSADTVRKVLALPNPKKPRRIENLKTKAFEDDISQQEAGIRRLRARYSLRATELEDVVTAFRAYAAKQTTLDDPQELIRTLRGSGALSFRIAPRPGELASDEEESLRSELAARGPGQSKRTDLRWYKINQITNWYESVQARDSLLGDPNELEPRDPAAREAWQRARDRNVAGFFAGRGLIGAQYLDGYYVLLWNTPESKLTQEMSTKWGVSLAAPTRDDVGKPAIRFEMDNEGAKLLGELTGKHVGKPMAVQLDDEVYTAPNLNSEISRSGQITGSFSDEEIRYIVKVLSAGALAAKLSPEPISTTVLAAPLGKDNLDKGLRCGFISFVLCSSFMIVYYFTCGAVATVALAINTLLLVAVMAFNKAAFTLPGIAGVILSFATAVDANVLIYERMREELQRGATLKDALRLGYGRAMSAIVDGNISNLIHCIVLWEFGTAEIRGFAITMCIGVVTTLFAQLYVTRRIFELMLALGWKSTTMLPIAVPLVQRAFTFHIDWIGKRQIFYAISAVAVVVSVALAYTRGEDMYDMEFRGGTAVTVELKTASDGQPLKLHRDEVEKRYRAVAEEPGRNPDLKSANVQVVNPDRDGVTSSIFKIKTLVFDQAQVQEVVDKALGDVIQKQEALVFKGSGAPRADQAPIFAITRNRLGDNIKRPDVGGTVPEYRGGVAVVLEDLTPRPTLDELTARITKARNRPDMKGALRTSWEVLVIDGSDKEVRTAVVVSVNSEHQAPDNANDVAAESTDDEGVNQWRRFVRDTEWVMIKSALTESTSLSSIQNFSPAIADTFKLQAIWCVLFSAILMIAYIWVRFGSLRYSLAAILPTFLDCVVAVGCVAGAALLYEHARPVADFLWIMPFKIDLTVVAAILTVLGYSINDKIVVLDRIRENRGKSPFASTKLVNDSVNQCISRTMLTGSTIMLSTLVLYLLGGDSLRPFAYSLGVGVIIGTASSMMLSAPMVCKDPPSGTDMVPKGAGAGAA